jgi:two-component system CheB/CheR fusion protein
MLNSDYYAILNELKKKGFRLSIDDFGTGYARYKTLIDLFDKSLVDEVKIDKVFVDNLDSTANQSFVRSIGYLANEFGIGIVAEGVETSDQLARLLALNPRIIIQGWLVGKAMPVDEVEIFDGEALARVFRNGSVTLP